mgnify:CR=1 FL=1
MKSQDFPNKKWLYVSVQVIPLRRDTSPTRAGPVLHLNFSFPAGAIENKCREFRRFGITFVSGISFQRCPILAKRPVFLHGERRIPGRYFKAVISDDSQSKVTFVSSLRRRMIIMARSWCNYVLRICDRLIYVVIFVKK